MPKNSHIDYISLPTQSLKGSVQIPGDKSISHRAVIFGAIASGITKISGLLKSADTISTINVFREMGVQFDETQEHLMVHGVGLNGLKAPTKSLDFGNSGTSVRLMAGLLAAQNFDSTLTGDASLSQRPMQRIIEPLMKMGAKLQYSEQGTLPINITGGNTLKAISYQMPVASAQLKSCLLLAGLYASGKTTICEPSITRDHTERMLLEFGGDIRIEENCFEIQAGKLEAKEIVVPGDISSAAFLIVAASICPGSDLILKNVGFNPTRNAVVEILSMMGADIQVDIQNDRGVEPVADIRVQYSQLNGIKIPSSLVPIAIDEFPIIMIAAACARGETVLTNAGELRVKESDRIDAIASGLIKLGIDVITREDGMTVTGGILRGGIVDSHGDHRIAMAFAIAASIAKEPVKILDCMNVNTSFPAFIEVATSIGLKINSQKRNV
jgi:3-phosphoshikimate 1-carboxyvinyltransferase